MTVLLALVVGILYAAGAYLLLQRQLTRVIIGLALMGHGANLLLLLSGGRPGAPPLIGTDTHTRPYSDPLPQAMALTAIVITFAVVAFLLALAYRSRTLEGGDAVEGGLDPRPRKDVQEQTGNGATLVEEEPS